MNPVQELATTVAVVGSVGVCSRTGYKHLTSLQNHGGLVNNRKNMLTLEPYISAIVEEVSSEGVA